MKMSPGATNGRTLPGGGAAPVSLHRDRVASDPEEVPGEVANSKRHRRMLVRFGSLGTTSLPVSLSSPCLSQCPGICGWWGGSALGESLDPQEPSRLTAFFTASSRKDTLFASLAIRAGFSSLAISRGVFFGLSRGPALAFLLGVSPGSSAAATASRPHCFNMSVRSVMSSEDNCIPASSGGFRAVLGRHSLGQLSAQSFLVLSTWAALKRLPPGGVVLRIVALWPLPFSF